MSYTDLTSRFVYKNTLLWSDLDAFAQNDFFLKTNNWADGTVALFFQAAAPSGWTKITTQNNKFLRVVSGAGGGSGGTTAPTATIVLQHAAHTIATAASHTHVLNTHSHNCDSGPNAASSLTGPDNVADDGSGFLRLMRGTSGSITRLLNSFDPDGGTLTTDSQGSHNHGGNTATNALTDLTFSYIDIILCSKNTATGYVDWLNSFKHGDQIDYNPFPDFYTNDVYLSGQLTPFAAVSIFYNAVAPTGWTKLTTANDKALRVVSGTGGAAVAGSQGFGTTITLQHTHTMSAGGAHTHTMPAHTHTARSGSTISSKGTSATFDKYISDDGTYLKTHLVNGSSTLTVYKKTLASGGNSLSDDPGNHTHTIANALTDVTIAYADVIQASKDSAGAPYVLTNLTGRVAYKKLVSYQRLTEVAKNDAYLNYHTMPAGAVCHFFQASAPLSWTNLATNTDKALRIVSGSSGGSTGGSAGLGATITIAHNHQLSSDSHNHSLSHTHTWDSGSVGSLQAAESDTVNGTTFSDGFYLAGLVNSGVFPWGKKTIAAQTVTTVNASHDHGGATGSGLSDVSLAYIDIIQCQKN